MAPEQIPDKINQMFFMKLFFWLKKGRPYVITVFEQRMAKIQIKIIIPVIGCVNQPRMNPHFFKKISYKSNNSS